MIRGQLCLYETTTDRHGWSPAGGVGIVEAPAGTLVPERILPFIGICLGTDHLLSTGPYEKHAIEDFGHEMSDHVREAKWSRPIPGSGIPGGGIFFRRTRIPASSGHEIMTLAICMYAPAGSVRSQMLYSLSGVADDEGRPTNLSIYDPVVCAPLAENGIGMAALLKRPVWGWGEEKFALQSTMRLDVIDDALEVRRLLDLPSRSETEEKRLQDMRRRPGHDVVAANHYQDPRYAEFRRRMPAMHPHDDWSKPISAGQIRAHEERAGAIVREMMAEAA